MTMRRVPADNDRLEKSMSLDRFLAYALKPENLKRHLEYISGKLVEVVSNNESSHLGAKMLVKIGGFVDAHRLGRVTGADGGYIIVGERYIPDVAYVSYQRQPRSNREAYSRIPPELVVEVLSPSNTEEEIAHKVKMYLAEGAVVWVIDPEDRRVDVYIGKQVASLRDGDILGGGDVLPGFTLPVRDIFED